jgi:two-component sensor histidine kinase/PAS domain-containing protein
MAALEKESKAVETYDLETSYVRRSAIKEIQDTVNAFSQMKRGLARYQQQNLELAEGLKSRARDLQSKELQLRSTLTTLVNFSDALIVLDRTHGVQFLNPEAERLLNIDMEHFLGRCFPYSVHLGEIDEIHINREGMAPCIAEMRVVETEWEGENAFLVALRDITEAKGMEKEIQWRTATLQYLHDTALLLPSRESLPDLYGAIASRVVDYLECKGVWIFSWSMKNRILIGEFSDRLSPDIAGRRAIVTDSCIDEVIASGQSTILEDFCQSQIGKLLLHDEALSFEQCIVTPLVWGNRTLGIVVVGGDPEYPFTEKDNLLMERLGHLAAAALDQKQLLAETEELYRRADEDARTKSVLLKEINHRVKNNMAAIIGLLYAERRFNPAREKTEFREALNGVIHQIQALATVHDLLSDSNWEPLPLDRLVSKVIGSTFQSLSRDKHVTVAVSPEPIQIVPAAASSLAMIIHECATNTIKHALSDLEQCQINVNIRVDENDRKVHLSYRDSGPGYPGDVLQGKRQNTGLYLLENIVKRELSGDLVLANENGALTRISFKVPSLRIQQEKNPI